jgi:uncharacterized protein
MERPYQSFAGDVPQSSPLVKVFTWMAVALGFTAVMAMGVFLGLINNLITEELYGTLLIGSIVTLLISYFWFLFGSFRQNQNAAPTIPFFLYAGSMGVLLSTLPFAYSIELIGTAFGVSALVFAVFAIYGATTKTNLLGLGQFVFVALFGLIILSLLNIFIGSTGLDWMLSFAIFGVVLLMVAYQVWVAKQLALAGELTNARAMFLAFSLYIAFINIFLRILRFIAIARGGRR